MGVRICLGFPPAPLLLTHMDFGDTGLIFLYRTQKINVYLASGLSNGWPPSKVNTPNPEAQEIVLILGCFPEILHLLPVHWPILLLYYRIFPFFFAIWNWNVSSQYKTDPVYIIGASLCTQYRIFAATILHKGKFFIGSINQKHESYITQSVYQTLWWGHPMATTDRKAL